MFGVENLDLNMYFIVEIKEESRGAGGRLVIDLPGKYHDFIKISMYAL